ncbi:hypothetical protein BCL90_2832 [Pedobacter alluvionis]|uniref:Uncharacterized protein n=1 Tax=Pedobacter alluvionis TaxID=475253 RepID=A0A497Y6W1_9SPHI|nr:hypothetical protein BCL90_2832 [Pedobacter alluvionis]TFB33073.1 hypothetical protein E3V97_03260 [Pedobacter alluvionis]
MQIHLLIVGVVLVALALIHVIFPKYFNWQTELKLLSLINRQMMLVHTFFVALTVFLMGLLCLTSSNELIYTDLGRKISLGLGLFWITRFFIQFFVYSKDLWKGKLFETTVHAMFSILWAYFSFVFLFIFFKY